MNCRLSIKAIPNAPRSELAGWLGEVVKIKVHAPALEGRANDELCAFLAEKLALPKRMVSLAQGEKSRQKVVVIDGISIEEVKARLLTKETR